MAKNKKDSDSKKTKRKNLIKGSAFILNPIRYIPSLPYGYQRYSLIGFIALVVVGGIVSLALIPVYLPKASTSTNSSVVQPNIDAYQKGSTNILLKTSSIGSFSMSGRTLIICTQNSVLYNFDAFEKSSIDYFSEFLNFNLSIAPVLTFNCENSKLSFTTTLNITSDRVSVKTSYIKTILFAYQKKASSYEKPSSLSSFLPAPDIKCSFSGVSKFNNGTTIYYNNCDIDDLTGCFVIDYPNKTTLDKSATSLSQPLGITTLTTFNTSSSTYQNTNNTTNIIIETSTANVSTKTLSSYSNSFTTTQKTSNGSISNTNTSIHSFNSTISASLVNVTSSSSLTSVLNSSLSSLTTLFVSNFTKVNQSTALSSLSSSNSTNEALNSTKPPTSITFSSTNSSTTKETTNKINSTNFFNANVSKSTILFDSTSLTSEVDSKTTLFTNNTNFESNTPKKTTTETVSNKTSSTSTRATTTTTTIESMLNTSTFSYSSTSTNVKATTQSEAAPSSSQFIITSTKSINNSTSSIISNTTSYSTNSSNTTIEFTTSFLFINSTKQIVKSDISNYASKNTTNILFDTTSRLLNSTQPKGSTMESSTSTDQITVELNNIEGEIN